MSDVILTAKGLERRFGGIQAIGGVDLQVERGHIHAIIGPNGSGKTTLFNLITGHTPPSAGTVQFNGIDITGSPYHKVVRRGLVKSYQITTVFPLLDVFENVRIAAQAATASYVFWRPASSMKAVLARADEVLELVGLSERRDQIAGTLSHGDQRRLDLAIALATDPELLLLDEPTAGMSPVDTEATVELIRELNSQDLTILMIEHKMDIILGIADLITVLHQGTILFEGLPAAVQEHPQVRDVYLTGSV